MKTEVWKTEYQVSQGIRLSIVIFILTWLLLGLMKINKVKKV